MAESELLTQHQQALDILCGLHPCITVDGPPQEVAIRIFHQVQAERTLLQERVTVLEDTIQLLSRQIRGQAR